MFTNRITRTAALGLTLAAAIASPATALTDLRAPDTRDTATRAASPDLRSPDARDAAVLPAGRTADLRSPDTRDVAAGRTPSSSPEVAVIKIAQPTPALADGIDWADAGLGAGVSLPVLVALAAALGLGLPRRSVRGGAIA